jgi:hypothetical protein
MPAQTVRETRIQIMMPAQTDAVLTPSTKPKRTRAAKPDSRKAASRQKITLVVSDAVDFRLGALAAYLKVDRSTLAAKLLDQGMRAYAVDAAFRSVSGQSDDRQDIASELNSAA